MENYNYCTFEQLPVKKYTAYNINLIFIFDFKLRFPQVVIFRVCCNICLNKI